VVKQLQDHDHRWLVHAIDSVLRQLYPYWELCIADDASTRPRIAGILRDAAAQDERIRIVTRAERGHISAASNSALALANGDFIALLDHDDVLPEHALYRVAAEIERRPDADMLFSDEDKLDEHGRRFGPYFKSDWNPDLLLSQNAVSHLGVYRRTLVAEVGGFREGLEGSQDHDLALRVSERTQPWRIRHIPEILYHWRVTDQSTARAPAAKPYAWNAGARAIGDALQRRGIEGEVRTSAMNAFYRVWYKPPAELPTVSVIVPTRDQLPYLSRIADGVLNGTEYPALELVIVDNDSTDPQTHAYLRELEANARVRVLNCPGPFNFSAINNHAAQKASGSVLCFLNNDTEVLHVGWLTEMVVHALRQEVGAVGARLLYPNGRIQHAGVVVGMGGVAGHVHRLYASRDLGYFGRASLIQDVSAVTAACLVMRRRVFERAGGFDTELPVAFNDVDLCLRLRQQGFRLVWTPYATLRHHESVSRGADDVGANAERFRREAALMRERWGVLLDNDPFFSPNLSLASTSPIPAFPPRRQPAWAGFERE
jgi:GT2 family glycosyltransferase